MKRALAIAVLLCAACLCGAWTARTTIPAALVATQTISAGEDPLAPYGYVFDYSSYANHGVLMPTATNGPTWQSATRTGDTGGQYSFNGSTQYVDSETTNSVGTGDFTTAFWMKPSAIAASQCPFSSGVFAGGWTGWHYETATGGKMYWFIYYANGLLSNTTFTNGTWYHIAGVRQGDNQYFFVNGVLDTSRSVPAYNVNNGSPILVGRNPDTTYPRYFPGLIDEPTIWHAALTSNQVYQLATSNTAPTNAPRIWYKMNTL
jgi:hypothetical protein